MSIEEQIGEKIRNLRNQNGLTQEELADRTELTKGFISQLERGLTAPSVSTLYDIVECLGTNLSDFFHEEENQQIVFPRKDYFEKEDAAGNNIQWLIATGYVLDGKIMLHYGEEKMVVRKGDSFIFPANRKHMISSASRKVSVFLWISSPPSF